MFRPKHLSNAATALVLASLLSLGVHPVSASDIASPCPKVGATKKTNGVFYRCVKDTKRLKRWRIVSSPATPTTSTTSATSTTSTVAATCVNGGVCEVGDLGPGGGTVFYDAGSMQSWGRYLEAAPSDLAQGFFWDDAVNLARSYVGGGYSNWRLPTKDELAFLFTNKGVLTGLDTSRNSFYWSSTEYTQHGNNHAWGLSLYSGKPMFGGKFTRCSVRPIRAF